MTDWQSCHPDCGGRVHRQFRKAAFDGRCQDIVRRNLKIIPLQSRFDVDFQNADGEEHNVIIRAVDGGVQRVAKSLRRAKRPEQASERDAIAKYAVAERSLLPS